MRAVWCLRWGALPSIVHPPSSLSGVVTAERLVVALAVVCGVVTLSVASLVTIWSFYEGG